MELILKSAAAALSAALVGLLLRKFNPELSGLISLCTIVLIFMAVLGFAAELEELISLSGKLINVSDIYISAIFKCLGISVLSRLSSDLCRDCGQSALSSTVDFAGCICAMMVVLPLILNMVKLIGTMV